LRQQVGRGGADRGRAEVHHERGDADGGDYEPPAVARGKPEGHQLRFVAQLGEEDQGEGNEKGRHWTPPSAGASGNHSAGTHYERVQAESLVRPIPDRATVPSSGKHVDVRARDYSPSVRDSVAGRGLTFSLLQGQFFGFLLLGRRRLLAAAKAVLVPGHD